jgi:hypothetical protein
MRRVLVSLLIVPALAIAPAPASALGFSRSSTPSLLGQPLDFDAIVRLAPDETLERSCVNATVRAGEIRVPAEQVRVALRSGADPAERVVHVSTVRPLDEPIVTVEVSVGCGARVTRSFVAFLDPPALQLAKGGDEAAPPDSASGDGVAQARIARGARDERARAPDGATNARPRAALAVRRVASQARHAAGPSGHGARGARVAAVASRSGPRLTLEAPALLAAGPDAMRPSTGANAGDAALPASAAAVAPASIGGSAPAPSGPAIATTADAEHARLVAELAQERARLQAIEADVTRMRRDALEMQRTIVALQTRLQQAPAGDAARTPLYLLATLCGLLLGGLALAWRRVPLARRWWEATQLPPAAPAVASGAAQVETPAASTGASPQDVGPLTETPADEPWRYQRPTLDAPRPGPAPAAIGGLEVTTVLDHAILAQIARANAAPPLEPEGTPIDRLIDLEQQAEFFLVLGEDDRAIELLASALHGPAGDSPMPYLHLLALHRGRGERPAWLRVAEQLQARFGAELPSWSDADERTLETQHAVMERLQRVWAWPGEAMRALEGWLFHRHAGDARFGWAAYDDLLMLYGLAREHADAATGVDLLLPMENTQPAPVEAMPAFRLSHFGAVEVPLRRALDLDISEPGPLDSRPAPLRRAI